ncbi:GntR family transcriptional regulator [Amycolatopsis sp. cmx-4-54]|uniref:GntR family transcriptional regulator n=1 Tax=Amycolatopsis sp. cmx-4-54 TaxID=2790936 RepID=UPI00397AAAA4
MAGTEGAVEMGSDLRRSIADELRRAIELGEYPPGSTLPPAAELATTWDTTRWLITNVYNDLQEEGLVRVGKRSGTVVVDQRRENLPRSPMVSRDVSGYLFESAPWKQLGELELITVPVRATIADLLDLKLGDEVLTRAHVLGWPIDRSGGRATPDPIQIVTSTLPNWIVAQLPTLAEPTTAPGSVLDRIEESFGGPLTWTDLVGAERADRVEAHRLNVRAGSPVLHVHTITRLRDGRPVEVTTRSVSGDRFRLGPTPLPRGESAAWPPHAAP